MKSVGSVVFILLIPILSLGVGKSVVNMGSSLIRSLGLKSEFTQFFNRFGIDPKSIPEETLKDLNEAWEDPLRLIDIDPEGAGSSNFSWILGSDVHRAFLFFRLNPSDEQQMKRLIALLEREAEFMASHYIVPGLTARERRKTLKSTLPLSWENFMNGLKKEITSGRIKPQRKVDLEAGILSASKTEPDAGTPLHKDLDELGMYDLHENRVVRSPDEDKLVSETFEHPTVSQYEDNIVPITRGRASRLLEDGYSSLLEYNIKPRLLFNIIVWRGENKPGRYRFLPDPDTMEMVKTPYQYTRDEIQRLTEIYTNPHFNLKPHHFHWDEVAVPVIQDGSSYANKEFILRAWKDFEWTMHNGDYLLSHRTDHLDPGEIFRGDLLEPPNDSFMDHIRRAMDGDSKNASTQAILKACSESESLTHYLR